jgi:HEAT repeat protein
MTLLRRLYPLGFLVLLAGCGKSTADWAKELKSSDPATRLHAVHALRERTGETESVVAALTEALGDQDTAVRRDAARSLGQFGAEARDAVPALVERLRDQEPSVRKAAGQALKQIDPPAAARAGVR